MPFFLKFKSTVFYLSICFLACEQLQKSNQEKTTLAVYKHLEKNEEKLIVAANRTEAYLPYLQDKNIAIVANQTSVIFKEEGHTHLVDSLKTLGVAIRKVFSPEHGFRGTADAGEKVNDGIDAKTGLPIKSLHGKNRKPTQEQLKDIDIVLFDIQDVGVRFYTYIATLQLLMEACSEARIPVLILDRPNPNAHYIDGPTMEDKHINFLGLQKIPLVYGMTIGEYAYMINEEGWLHNASMVDLTVIPLLNYNHNSDYSLPIRPSPNLPNDQSIKLYPSLGLFEGTNINAGRGTEFQFQRYGASFLDSTAFDFKYEPNPNFGSKHPKEKGKICYGENLFDVAKVNEVSLKWLLKAYNNCIDKTKFFKTNGFTKHAGNTNLQKQIEAGFSEEEIREEWKKDITTFKKIRKKYLLYH